MKAPHKHRIIRRKVVSSDQVKFFNFTKFASTVFLLIAIFVIIFTQTPDNKIAFMLFFVLFFAIIFQLLSLFMSEQKRGFLMTSLITAALVLKALSMATLINYLLLLGIFICFWLFSKSSK